MSAREELYALAMKGKGHSPDNSERMSARIDAFKADVLREAAEKIRMRVDDRQGADLMRIFWRGAANYIDPDKDAE